MGGFPEQWIIGCVQKGWLDFSDHARQRMIERSIEKEQIVECILRGKVIELQTQFKDVHVLFQEPTTGKPEIYVIVAAAYPFPLVVSVCRTEEEVWEYRDGYLKRRKRK